MCILIEVMGVNRTNNLCPFLQFISVFKKGTSNAQSLKNLKSYSYNFFCKWTYCIQVMEVEGNIVLKTNIIFFFAGRVMRSNSD